MMIKNVAYECTRDELQELFKDYNPVENSVYIVKNPRTGEPTGEVTIDFQNMNAKRSAQIRMHNVIFKGRNFIIT